MREPEAYNNKSNILVQARHLCWSMSVKYSIVRCLSNAVVKVPRNCWERTLNFRNNTFHKKIIITATLSSNCSLIPLFPNKNKNKNTEYYGTFISFKSHLFSKQGSPILLLFRSWSVVLYLHVWVKPKVIPILLVCQF